MGVYTVGSPDFFLMRNSFKRSYHGGSVPNHDGISGNLSVAEIVLSSTLPLSSSELHNKNQNTSSVQLRDVFQKVHPKEKKEWN